MYDCTFTYYEFMETNLFSKIFQVFKRTNEIKSIIKFIINCSSKQIEKKEC